MFEECKDAVTSVLDGYNVTLFAYGQTGAGKTHTMYGSAADGRGGKERRLALLEDLFFFFRDFCRFFRDFHRVFRLFWAVGPPPKNAKNVFFYPKKPVFKKISARN